MTTEATSYQRLREHLGYLQMTTAAEQLSAELDRALKQKLSPTQVLENLLELDVEATRARRQRGRLRFARYPVLKTLADFDLTSSPRWTGLSWPSSRRFASSRRSATSSCWACPAWARPTSASPLVSPPPDAGYRTLFTSAADLVAALQSAHLEGNAQYKMRAYIGLSVLVIDELGYLPLDQTSANWIFQVVTRRYDKGAIVMTSNRGFSDWGQVFSDAVVAGAIVDRLIHNATVLNIRGRSYRMRAYQPDDSDPKGGDAKVR